MKKMLLYGFLAAAVFTACKKDDAEDTVTLTASKTVVTLGEAVELTAVTGSPSIHWSVTPDAGVTKQFSGTSTSKTNTMSFSSTGEYIVVVKTGDDNDRSYNQNGNQAGGGRRCNKDDDSASVKITVIK
jgi:hypothetical protein